MIYPAEHGNQGLRKPEKIFLDNSNVLHAINGLQASQLDVGNLRELFVVQSFSGAGVEIHHSKQGDFRVGDSVLEVGGKNKTRKQLIGVDNAFLIKDDVLMSSKGVIPLLFLGFLY